MGQGHDRSVGTIDDGVVHGVVLGIFRAAVRDRLIVANPCDGTRLPKATKSRVEPLPSRPCSRWLTQYLPISGASDPRLLARDASGRMLGLLWTGSTSCAAWCM